LPSPHQKKTSELGVFEKNRRGWDGKTEEDGKVYFNIQRLLHSHPQSHTLATYTIANLGTIAFIKPYSVNSNNE
jgi:hypothetical protein